MSEDFIKVFDNLANKFGITIDWTNENVFPYLQDFMNRFVKYNVVSNALWIFICALFIILSVVGLKKIITSLKNEEDPDLAEFDTLYFMGILFLSITLVTSVIYLFSNGFDIIQTIYLPEFTFLEYMKGL